MVNKEPHVGECFPPPLPLERTRSSPRLRARRLLAGGAEVWHPAAPSWSVDGRRLNRDTCPALDRAMSAALVKHSSPLSGGGQRTMRQRHLERPIKAAASWLSETPLQAERARTEA